MTQPHDARSGSGDPLTDPAAAGERAAETLDGDGGAVPAQEQERAAQERGTQQGTGQQGGTQQPG